MASTIFDVANRAGVSISTVSRVLNGKDRVHPDTRARVWEAVRELSYQTNAFAHGLATQRTHMLGFVIPQINDPFFMEIVRGVEEQAAESGYSLLVASQPQQPGEHRYLQLFQRSYVDAMVLVSIDVSLPEVEQILDRGVPVVLVQQDIGGKVPTVVADNYGGARALAKHLVDLHGYRRIAYIAGTDITPDSALRLRALEAILKEHDLALDARYVVRGNYLRGSGRTAMRELLARQPWPEAVFAANDQMASDAILAIREQGLRVPEDIAVVGFDDVPLASYVVPTLTTVRQPIYEMGVEAGRIALRMIDAGLAGEPHRVTLPTKLVVRNSCGCVA